MPKKKTINPIETYVEEIVTKVLDSKENKLKEEDAAAIVKAIIPEIEVIVSKIVLKHFQSIAVYMQNNLKNPEDI